MAETRMPSGDIGPVLPPGREEVPLRGLEAAPGELKTEGVGKVRFSGAEQAAPVRSGAPQRNRRMARMSTHLSMYIEKSAEAVRDLAVVAPSRIKEWFEAYVQKGVIDLDSMVAVEKAGRQTGVLYEKTVEAMAMDIRLHDAALFEQEFRAGVLFGIVDDVTPFQKWRESLVAKVVEDVLSASHQQRAAVVGRYTLLMYKLFAIDDFFGCEAIAKGLQRLRQIPEIDIIMDTQVPPSQMPSFDEVMARVTTDGAALRQEAIRRHKEHLPSLAMLNPTNGFSRLQKYGWYLPKHGWYLPSDIRRQLEACASTIGSKEAPEVVQTLIETACDNVLQGHLDQLGCPEPGLALEEQSSRLRAFLALVNMRTAGLGGVDGDRAYSDTVRDVFGAPLLALPIPLRNRLEDLARIDPRRGGSRDRLRALASDFAKVDPLRLLRSLMIAYMRGSYESLRETRLLPSVKGSARTDFVSIAGSVDVTRTDGLLRKAREEELETFSLRDLAFVRKANPAVYSKLLGLLVDDVHVAIAYAMDQMRLNPNDWNWIQKTEEWPDGRRGPAATRVANQLNVLSNAVAESVLLGAVGPDWQQPIMVAIDMAEKFREMGDFQGAMAIFSGLQRKSISIVLNSRKDSPLPKDYRRRWEALESFFSTTNHCRECSERTQERLRDHQPLVPLMTWLLTDLTFFEDELKAVLRRLQELKPKIQGYLSVQESSDHEPYRSLRWLLRILTPDREDRQAEIVQLKGLVASIGKLSSDQLGDLGLGELRVLMRFFERDSPALEIQKQLEAAGEVYRGLPKPVKTSLGVLARKELEPHPDAAHRQEDMAFLLAAPGIYLQAGRALLGQEFSISGFSTFEIEGVLPRLMNTANEDDRKTVTGDATETATRHDALRSLFEKFVAGATCVQIGSSRKTVQEWRRDAVSIFDEASSSRVHKLLEELEQRKAKLSPKNLEGLQQFVRDAIALDKVEKLHVPEFLAGAAVWASRHDCLERLAVLERDLGSHSVQTVQTMLVRRQVQELEKCLGSLQDDHKLVFSKKEGQDGHFTTRKGSHDPGSDLIDKIKSVMEAAEERGVDVRGVIKLLPTKGPLYQLIRDDEPFFTRVKELRPGYDAPV